MTFQEILSLNSLQNKAKNGKSTESKVKSNTPQGSLDMREVLKGLGSVKLKTVPRLVIHNIQLRFYLIMKYIRGYFFDVHFPRQKKYKNILHFGIYFRHRTF